MACLEMYNNSDHHKNHCPQSPRISFSNDFADSQQILKNHHEIRPSSSNVSSDFEFSVSNYSMMSADELFCKGRFLPFKNNSSNQAQRTTIRDELLAGDDDHHQVSLRPPKGASSARWRGLLGLKRSHIGSKKIDNNNNNNSSHSSDARRPGFSHELPKNNSQEYLSTEGGSSNRDVEIGI
ncbi:hypothetical protein M5689_012631 [Euphorbia peplus]|nr:hypothetical protein M5689_012631 [Euphorbia peplus]